jgi:nucleoside-diphosphate-sugar epimerase
MLLFGSIKSPSKAEIMASFPSRYTTDMLIARYFNTYSPGTRKFDAAVFRGREKS